MTSTANIVLEAKQVTKVYGGRRGLVRQQALDGVDLQVQAGEFIGIMGPSGSGKTTLLNILATIDEPTSGSIAIAGVNPRGLRGDDLALFRRRELGFASVNRSRGELPQKVLRSEAKLPHEHDLPVIQARQDHDGATVMDDVSNHGHCARLGDAMARNGKIGAAKELFGGMWHARGCFRWPRLLRCAGLHSSNCCDASG
jgi:ABC-type oligopeptide transport system ATPase subunit